MIYNAYAEQKDSFLGMTLVSCGHIFAKNGREIYRPHGREDWLLFYIVKESETFYLNGIETGKAGSFILFAPGEKQHHIYLGNKTAEFYYVHFNCDALPDGINLETSRLYHLPPSRQICDLFEAVIDETLKKQPLYERLCLLRLINIFTLLERGVFFEAHPERENFKRVAVAVQHINKHYDAPLTLDAYAEMCAMSKYHFIRVFEKIVGTTPLEYRNNVRMEHAAELLTEENLSVEEISRMTGFSSPSYFSSAFRKKYGVPPREYQKKKSEN